MSLSIIFERARNAAAKKLEAFMARFEETDKPAAQKPPTLFPEMQGPRAGFENLHSFLTGQSPTP